MHQISFVLPTGDVLFTITSFVSCITDHMDDDLSIDLEVRYILILEYIKGGTFICLGVVSFFF